MAKAEWGQKRICAGCGAKFYDMKKNPPVCPECKKVYDVEAIARTRAPKAEDKRKVTPALDDVDAIPVADGDDGDDAIIEDAEELGEDVVDEVIEVEDDEEVR